VVAHPPQSIKTAETSKRTTAQRGTACNFSFMWLPLSKDVDEMPQKTPLIENKKWGFDSNHSALSMKG